MIMATNTRASVATNQEVTTQASLSAA
jgi:hypothetical protein